MYNGGTCRTCPDHPATQLGIAPLVSGAILYAAPRVINWLTGHSTMYSAMQAAIPQLQQLALAGDVPAYIVLRAWFEEGDWCTLAEQVARPYLINMPPNATGPCGAPPGLKNLVLQALARVTGGRPDVATIASQALAIGPSANLEALIAALPAGAITAPAGDQGPLTTGASAGTPPPTQAPLDTTTWLWLGGGVLALRLFLPAMRRR